MAASHGYATRLAVNALSFIPTLFAMAVPIVLAAWLTDRWPTFAQAWAHVWAFKGLAAFACFMVYVSSCAGHELVRAWRQALRIL